MFFKGSLNFVTDFVTKKKQNDLVLMPPDRAIYFILFLFLTALSSSPHPTADIYPLFFLSYRLMQDSRVTKTQGVIECERIKKKEKHY